MASDRSPLALDAALDDFVDAQPRPGRASQEEAEARFAEVRDAAQEHLLRLRDRLVDELGAKVEEIVDAQINEILNRMDQHARAFLATPKEG